MGMSWEDVVLIEESKNSGDPTVVTVNCPDKAGLGCDLLRVVLEFGLYVTRGDFSTDGKWCYVILWVVPRPNSLRVDWESFKKRLVSCCPSIMPTFYLDQLSSGSKAIPLYLLKVFSMDRKGLIHDVTKLLCDLELTIQRLKVMTTPDGKVLDLFFVTDSMNTLNTKIGREETCEHINMVLGECCISCEINLAGPEYECQNGLSSIPESIAEKLFSCEFQVAEDASKVKEASVIVDNLLSPAHSLLQIQCRDQKGLIYDILRISKDCDIQIAYGRVSSSVNGVRNLELFIQNEDGKKILSNENQTTLCARLKEEMMQPLRVMISNRGPDTELLVANLVELSGKGRPRVVYDVTFALKTLGLCIFSAEIGRHSRVDREWEVYRFLLVENRRFPLTSKQVKQDIINKVRRTLMGCFYNEPDRDRDRSRSPGLVKRFRSRDRASRRDAPYKRAKPAYRQDYLCNKCRRPGHFARDCPNVTVCNNCGLPGHVAAECTSTTMCWNCKESGHVSSECPNEPVCHMCGKIGHLARDCHSPNVSSYDARLCNNCYKPGHVAADCTNDKACNNCRKTGHLARECRNDPICNICSISGHVARQCPKAGSSGLTGSGKSGPSSVFGPVGLPLRDDPFRDMICRSCGRPGHISRDCVPLIVICTNCGGRGHLDVECPSARVYKSFNPAFVDPWLRRY